MNWVVEFREFPTGVVPPLYHVEGELSETEFVWAVKAGPEGASLDPPSSWAGTEVRVRFRFPASLTDRRDDLVMAPFADADRLVLEPIAEPSDTLRAPEVAAATTLPGKVEAWARLEGVEVTSGVQQKLAQLVMTDAPTVLTEVRRRLDTDATIDSPSEEVLS